ncbi:MAG: carbohydrate kinase family protein [Rhodocyclaceae bacterium]|nr:carbohydrate kinase family protein [Rhodocyclaceae bacterium]
MSIAVISNAPVDIVSSIDSGTLAEFGLTKSICTPISWELAEKLMLHLDNSGHNSYVSPGGCGVNTAVWLKMLGLRPTLVAPFGLDNFGRLARWSISELQIKCLGYNYEGVQSLAFTLITDDKDRTFASVQGQVPTTSLAEILSHLQGTGYLLIDGYFLEHSGAIDKILNHVEQMKANGQQLIFCPNDTSVINRHGTAVSALVKAADVLLMNENEAEALFPNVSSPEVAKLLSGAGKAGAITDGPFGANIFNQTEVVYISPAEPPRDLVNTNGAGDAFAAGFVAGILHGYELTASGELGRACAGEILTCTGARPDLFQVQSAANKFGLILDY